MTIEDSPQVLQSSVQNLRSELPAPHTSSFRSLLDIGSKLFQLLHHFQEMPFRNLGFKCNPSFVADGAKQVLDCKIPSYSPRLWRNFSIWVTNFVRSSWCGHEANQTPSHPMTMELNTLLDTTHWLVESKISFRCKMLAIPKTCSLQSTACPGEVLETLWMHRWPDSGHKTAGLLLRSRVQYRDQIWESEALGLLRCSPGPQPWCRLRCFGSSWGRMDSRPPRSIDIVEWGRRCVADLGSVTFSESIWSSPV